MKNGLGFRIFKQYLRFFHDISYRKVYLVNTENIPEDGALMVVSNHQNSLSDVLAILLSIRGRNKRKLRAISRADIFNTVFKRFLRWVGVIPAYRLQQDGEESLANNNSTFNESSDELLNNGTIVIYPEGSHEGKVHLREFSSGYLRILFEAAEKSNFEKDLFILPSCNHYSGYFDMREEMMIKFGAPISLAPYYELYKTKPRTAQRQVNAVVWQKVADLMLNITDMENYEAINYLRNTYGIQYALKKGFAPDNLPEKLTSDKNFYAELETLKKSRENELNNIYGNVLMLAEKTNALHIKDNNFEKNNTFAQLLFKGFAFVLLLPLFVFAFIPNIFIFLVPRFITPRLKDKMFTRSVSYAISIVVTIPIFYTLNFALAWIFSKSFIWALVFLVSLPLLGVFAYTYMKSLKDWITEIRFHKLQKNHKLDELITLRTNIFTSLNKLLNII